MGKVNYTKSQETAIQYKGGNLLLSAAAGSGKTATLTARILRLLTEGDENGEVNLTDMLVVTYTRAAASELKGRITAAVLEAGHSTGNGTDTSERHISQSRLFKHISDVQRADISTIHSFLYKVLRPYFSALGLPPDMGIIDEAAASVLKSAAMQDTIDDFFDKPQRSDEKKASFFELADALAASRDAAALDAVLIDMADSLISAGKDEECLYSYADVLECDADRGFFKSVYGEYIKEHIRLMVRHYRRIFSDINDEFFTCGGKAGEKYGPALSDILNIILHIEDSLENGDYSAVRELISGYTPAPLGRLSGKDKTETSEYFKIVRDRFKKDMTSIKDSYFTASEEELAVSMRRTARILRRIGDVLEVYYKSFAKRKRAQNSLDYADLEIYAVKLLTDKNGEPTDAAREIGSRYKYIFIDEYQDTNSVQDSIFRAISRTAPRFMVGDIKQSIYRFRGAEPEVFSGYRDKWEILHESPDNTDNTPDKFSPDDGRCVFMSENFRCDEPVVRFVNMVSGYMFPFGGIPYTADDELIFGKGNSGGRAKSELCLIEKPRRTKSSRGSGDDVGDESGTENADGTEWNDEFNPEAEYVADRIASMIGRRLENSDIEHPVRASDIAIITRNLKGTAEVYGEALMRRGIQIKLKATVTPMSAKSAKLVMCILNLVDNPMREIYAAGAMRSPVFGFTTDDIVALKQYGGDIPLYMAVTRAAQSYDKSYNKSCDKPEDYGYAYVSDIAEESAESTEADFMPDAYEWAEPYYNTELDSETGISYKSLKEASDSEQSVPDEDDGLGQELKQKCVMLAKWVKRQKNVARGMKADKYIEFLYNELELSSIPEIFSDAAERTALNRLYEAARRYESGRFGGISGFIEYMNGNADKETAEQGEENAVSIVSIHSAKGLEYPVCFIVECGRERNKSDEQKKLLFDTVLGFGMALPDEGGLVRCDTAVLSGIAEKKRVDAINEEMRILYVAMTRARSKLIVTAKTQNAAALLESAEKDRDYISEWSVMECSCYRDIIVNAAAVFGSADFYETKVIELSDIHPYLPELDLSADSDYGRHDEDKSVDAEKTDSELSKQESGNDDIDKDDTDKIKAVLEENFKFSYPLDFLSKIPSKLNVSGLNPHILDDEDDIAVNLTEDMRFPDLQDETNSAEKAISEAVPENQDSGKIPLPGFMTGTPEIKAADKGTATHMFMQFMDIDRMKRLGVDAELERLVSLRYISAETAALVNKTHLNKFRESELFSRMCSADMIKREFRFNVLMPAENFTADEALAQKLRDNGIRVTVQGVVDCVFRDNGGLVLVDYKTDAMTRAEYASPKLGEEKLIRRHKNQLTYYRDICERLFGGKISETVIYSTALGRTIRVL